MELKTDYSDIKFAENGKLKLLIIVLELRNRIYLHQLHHKLLLNL